MAQFQDAGVPASTEPELQCSSCAPEPQADPQPQPQNAYEPAADAPLPQTQWNRLMHGLSCLPCRDYLRVWASCQGHLQIGPANRRHSCGIPRFDRRTWSEVELTIVFRAMAHNNKNWQIAEAILANWQKKVGQAKCKEESEKKRQKTEQNNTEAR